MTDETNNENNNPNNNHENNDGEILDNFKEIKEKYESELQTRDEQIKELEKKLKEKESEVDDTIKNLNDEVNEKLKQAEELKNLQKNVEELLHDKAEATVDKYIQEGKLVPAQKEKALQLCLSDQDMFIELYKNAPAIVDTTQKPKSHKINANVDKLAEYFKR